MEKNPDDIDLDQIMDMIDDENEENSTSFHQTSPEEKPEVDDTHEEKRSDDAKLVYETLNSNVNLKQELDKLRQEKDEAERIALQGVLNNFESRIDFSKDNIDRLKQDLVRARDEGDTAASVDIESKIRDNYDSIRDLKSKVDTYSPLLHQKRAQETHAQAKEPEGNRLAGEWLRDNEAWLTDARNSDKRDYANNLFKEMQSNHDMNSLGFWTKFEKQLGEFDNKKNQQRMPKNMVTYNSNGSGLSAKKPMSYKQNPEFVQRVAMLAKNVIKNEDLLKDQSMLNSMLKHYHKVYKAGNFKYLPQTAD